MRLETSALISLIKSPQNIFTKYLHKIGNHINHKIILESISLKEKFTTNVK